jgi:penicillin amidase
MTTIWLENVLLKQSKYWLPGGYRDYDALLAAAVENAVHAPEAPGNLLDWKWGAGSLIDIQNSILGRLPVIRRLTGPGRVPQAGHGLTVDQIGPNFGPSQRLTVDLADFDRTTLNLVTGQSGNFLSPYYTDQWKAWCEGFTFALPFSPAAVAGTKAHTLMLYPGT